MLDTFIMRLVLATTWGTWAEAVSRPEALSQPRPVAVASRDLAGDAAMTRDVWQRIARARPRAVVVSAVEQEGGPGPAPDPDVPDHLRRHPFEALRHALDVARRPTLGVIESVEHAKVANFSAEEIVAIVAEVEPLAARIAAGELALTYRSVLAIAEQAPYFESEAARLEWHIGELDEIAR
jgi:hypothetical protein